ncbi:MAG: hypothetical protein WC819_04105 [Parcubacteria group bacterium]|jgi:hypothetical protein
MEKGFESPLKKQTPAKSHEGPIEITKEMLESGEVDKLFPGLEGVSFENADFEKIFDLAREKINADDEIRQYIFTPEDLQTVGRIIEGEIEASKNSGVYNLRVNELLGDKQKMDEYVDNSATNLHKKIKKAIQEKLGSSVDTH